MRSFLAGVFSFTLMLFLVGGAIAAIAMKFGAH